MYWHYIIAALLIIIEAMLNVLDYVPGKVQRTGHCLVVMLLVVWLILGFGQLLYEYHQECQAQWILQESGGQFQRYNAQIQAYQQRLFQQRERRDDENHANTHGNHVEQLGPAGG